MPLTFLERAAAAEFANELEGSQVMIWVTSDQMILSLTGDRRVESLEQIMWWPLV